MFYFQEELQEIVAEIDTDNDKKISYEEFSVWYLASEQRLAAEVLILSSE